MLDYNFLMWFSLLIRCKCGFCQVTLLQNPLEAWCCQELKSVAESLTHQSVLADLSTIPCCVTLHPGFRPVCLEKWSLKMAARKYKTREQRRYRETGSENMYDSILCYFPVFKYILVLWHISNDLALYSGFYDVLHTENSHLWFMDA